MAIRINSSSGYCAGILNSFVSNITSSYAYADQSNEAAMVATSIIMFALATLFFNLSLFSRLSDISAILKPSVRFILSTSLSLFLPVMSYLFSEAKNESASSVWTTTELSLRARTILMWMILVELLRKKVEAILVSEGGVPGYSSTIERAARIAWLGYLVFHNLRNAGEKALYGALWVLAAAKLVQRFVTLELGKRSFAYGKNPQLVASYMEHVLHEEQLANNNNNGQLRGSELLKLCNYVVMGEEDLEKKAGPRGYQLDPKGLLMVESIDSTVVTVGQIWKTDKTILQKNPRLKRLCLSMALYKLLRRMLEGSPITVLEAQDCHRIIFNGLFQDDGSRNDEEGTAAAVALFQVLNDEVQFLSEYYHSVHPVVFSSPFFFLVNYILFPIVVCAFCVLTAILISNGDVVYAFRSFKQDNYIVVNNILRVAVCILKRVTMSPMTTLFSAVDLFITILLFLSFLYEEAWEFIVFSLSNWFVVSLLCRYVTTSKPGRFLTWAIRCILRLRNMPSRPSICLKQFSVLWLCRLSWIPTTRSVLPREAKKAIMERLADATNKPLSNGKRSSTLLQWSDGELLWACESDSIAEVILTWHIATVVLEARKQHTGDAPAAGGAGDRKVVTALSGYCAYLVAFHPELLPDDKDGTERVYKDTMAELKKEIGCWAYYCSPQESRVEKLMEIAPAVADDMASVLSKGARLGKILVKEAATDQVRVWKLLAELWTEVLVYAAPAAGELHLKAHREALAQGGEFITLLWALATHTGIARPVTTAGCV